MINLYMNGCVDVEIFVFCFFVFQLKKNRLICIYTPWIGAARYDDTNTRMREQQKRS